MESGTLVVNQVVVCHWLFSFSHTKHTNRHSSSSTIAGVHFASDNIAGLNIGQEILAAKLPHYLSHKYGSNRRAVEEKIARVRFDWNEYTTGECFL